MERRKYIVSKDQKTGLWYAHLQGYAYIPVNGSFSEKKSESMEYAKMYNGLRHRVEEIEQKRKEKFEKEMENMEEVERYCAYMLAL